VLVLPVQKQPALIELIRRWVGRGLMGCLREWVGGVFEGVGEWVGQGLGVWVCEGLAVWLNSWEHGRLGSWV
jgi:hypothetical protein